MFSKKALITGVSTLVLGVSILGAAYALPMNNTSIQSPKPHAQMQNNSGTPEAMPVNTMNQTAAGQAGNTTGETVPQTMPM